MSFCSFIVPRHIRLKWPNVTYIGDQEARYCNRKVQFFHEITDLWAKSLTVYLICDKGEHKARKEYCFTQINKDYYFVWESINKVSYFVSYEIQSMSASLHCGWQRVFKWEKYTSGLKFKNEKGKTSLTLNITMFFMASLPVHVCRGTKASLNLSLCTVAIFKRAHFEKPNHTERLKVYTARGRDHFHETRYYNY